MLTGSTKKPILQIHQSTIATLSEVEKFFLNLFVQDGKAVIIKDKKKEQL